MCATNTTFTQNYGSPLCIIDCIITNFNMKYFIYIFYIHV